MKVDFVITIPNYVDKVEIKNEVISSAYTEMMNGDNRILLATSRDTMVQDQHVANNTNFKADIFDVIGYLTCVPTQYVFLSKSDLLKSRNYYISVFRTKQSTAVNSVISVNTIQMNNCSSFCESQNMCSNNHCDCTKKQLSNHRYFGRDCLIRAQKLKIDDDKQVVILNDSQIHHYYFEISNNDDHYLHLVRLQDKMNVSFFINKQYDQYYGVVPAHPNYNDYQSRILRYNLNIKIPKAYLNKQYSQLGFTTPKYVQTLFLSFQNHENKYAKIQVQMYGYNSRLSKLSNITLDDLSQRGFFYFITVIVICITIMGCLCICFRTKICMHIMGERRSVNNSQRLRVRRSNKLTQQEIDQYLPTKQFLEYKPYILDQNDPSEYEDEVDCIICLESFKDNDQAKLTPCYHMYHATCLTEWVLLNQNCPFCRASLTRKDMIEKSKIQMIPKHEKKKSQSIKNIEQQVEIVDYHDNVQINRSNSGVRMLNDDAQIIQIRARNDQSVESMIQSEGINNYPDPGEIYMNNRSIANHSNNADQRFRSQENM